MPQDVSLSAEVVSSLPLASRLLLTSAQLQVLCLARRGFVAKTQTRRAHVCCAGSQLPPCMHVRDADVLFDMPFSEESTHVLDAAGRDGCSEEGKLAAARSRLRQSPLTLRLVA